MHRGQHCGNITLTHQLALSTLCYLLFEMASAMSSLQSDECPICTELLKNPRVLDCQHVFCLDCLETLESNKTIKCPQCRVVTDIPPGLYVRHLPKRGKVEAKAKPLKLIKKIKISHQISNVQIDEYDQVIYITTGDVKAPVQMYSLHGKPLGNLPQAGFGPYRSLAIDTKRGLILVQTEASVLLYDREGRQTGTIKSPDFKYLKDIVYQAHNDRYVVGDVNAHRMYYINPDTCKVVRTVPAEEARSADPVGRNFYMASSRSADNTTLATVDMDKGLVKLFDGDGMYVKSYGGTGGGYGQFNKPNGICVDSQGRVIVSDRNNQRLVRVSPDVVEQHREWQVLGGTKEFGLGKPHDIDITDDGLAAMASYTDRNKGPFHLAILSGLD